jgi:hypothetical protein
LCIHAAAHYFCIEWFDSNKKIEKKERGFSPLPGFRPGSPASQPACSHPQPRWKVRSACFRSLLGSCPFSRAHRPSWAGGPSAKPHPPSFFCLTVGTAPLVNVALLLPRVVTEPVTADAAQIPKTTGFPRVISLPSPYIIPPQARHPPFSPNRSTDRPNLSSLSSKL